MIKFEIEEINQCYDFAMSMKGNHHPNLIMYREDWEIFRDDIRGKLGEIAVRKYVEAKIPQAIISTDIDFSVSPRGKWDIADLVINDKYINVKSIKEYAKYLLIETKRYDEDGNYCYRNDDGTPIKNDYYILVRVAINPEVSKKSFKDNIFKRFLNNAWSWSQKKEVERIFWAEILGGISHQDFWRKKKYAPKGIRCTVKNLNAIVNDIPVSNLPDKLTNGLRKSDILQQDNYVLSSYYDLDNIDELL